MYFSEAYICNIGRTQELSRRMNKRVYPSSKLPVGFDPRPVQTNRVLMPILDARKKSAVPLDNRGFFSSERTFSPGDLAPYNGYMKNVDDESKLLNIIFPNQNAPQSKFIPDTKSDLYDNSYLAVGRKEEQQFPGLFQEQTFAPFNPNTCDLGGNLFNNSTRVQLMNSDCCDDKCLPKNR